MCKNCNNNQGLTTTALSSPESQEVDGVDCRWDFALERGSSTDLEREWLACVEKVERNLGMQIRSFRPQLIASCLHPSHPRSPLRITPTAMAEELEVPETLEVRSVMKSS